MTLTVIKFGGSSLSSQTLRQQAADIIIDRHNSNCFPLVVVSAPGRKGNPYATDTLLKLLPSQASKRHQAMIASCGEIISASLLAELLCSLGHDSVALTGWQAGIFTNRQYESAAVELIDTTRLKEEINRNCIPVICGFQGISSGEITTLGRGGSDTTAALIARAMEADQLELFKDVSGVYTADPQKVDKARLIKKLNYNEIAELSGNGSRIVHNPAVRQLADKNIPLFLGSTTSGHHGTCVKIDADSAPVTAITSRNSLTLISLNSPRNKNYSPIFSSFAQAQISLDFISVTNQYIQFVITNDKIDQAHKLLAASQWQYTIKHGFSKLTVTGSGMTGKPGVMAKLITHLEMNNICIDMATDSYSTISCLIAEKDEKAALNIIHAAFKLEVK